MIYQTIPVQYLDHTDLLKAIKEAMMLSRYANHLANTATERLMDDELSSGEAVDIGEKINILKNIECMVNHWIELLAKVASKCKIVSLKPDDKKIEDYLDKVANDFNDAYKEWKQQLPPLATKYNIEIIKYSSDFSNNGEVERAIEMCT